LRDTPGTGLRQRCGTSHYRPVPTLRIATLNTWKNEGGLPRRLDVIVRGLQALGPDIVLLQEVFRAPDVGIDVARVLASALGLTHAYAPARAKPRLWHGHPTASDSGLAILVRGTLAETLRLELPTTEAGGERIALFARVSIDGTMGIVASIHLAHLRGDGDVRRAQLAAVLAHPWWHDTAADFRALGGDANAPLESPELAWLRTHPSLHVTGVSDPHRATHPLPPRPDRDGRTIDHLWSLAPPGHTPARRLACGVALDAPIDTIWPSDHAAAWADLAVSSAHSDPLASRC